MLHDRRIKTKKPFISEWFLNNEIKLLLRISSNQFFNIIDTILSIRK